MIFDNFFLEICTLSLHLCVHAKSLVSKSLWPCGLEPAWLLCPWGSPGKNTGVGCHALLWGIFPTWGLKPCLLCLWHCQAGSLPLVPAGTLVKINFYTYNLYFSSFDTCTCFKFYLFCSKLWIFFFFVECPYKEALFPHLVFHANVQCWWFLAFLGKSFIDEYLVYNKLHII